MARPYAARRPRSGYLVSLLVALLGALVALGGTAVPAQAADKGLRAGQVSIKVSERLIGPVAGMPAATVVRLTSTGRQMTGTVVVRRVGGPVVATWPVSPTKRFTARWNGRNASGTKVRPGLYRVKAKVSHPKVGPTVRRGVTVRVATASSVWKTKDGWLRAVPRQKAVGRFHVEVSESKNQVLVVNRANRVVRRIPVGGNPGIAKPALSYVGDRTPMSYDYAWTKRLPWFVRLVHGRGIGSHAIPRYISNGRPTIPTSALGRPPGVHAPVSAGCLRMSDANARWFFHNVRAGTPVYWL
ncbi:MAG: L,D-transpeptidase [Jiangellales bacterium]